MKFEINQIVYLILFNGKISIEAMKINRIEVRRSINKLYFSGIDPKDSEQTYDYMAEKDLFSTKAEAISEIERQLSKIKDLQ